MNAGEPQPVEQSPDEQSPDERELLREEIEKVREDLGETVEALANKADLKGQVHDKVEDTKAQLHDKVEETKTQVHGKVQEVKAQLGGGQPAAPSNLPAPSNLRGTLASPVVPGAVAALCAVLLLRAIVRGRR